MYTDRLFLYQRLTKIYFFPAQKTSTVVQVRTIYVSLSTSGRRIRTDVPRSAVESMAMVPPLASTTRLTIEMPIPEPRLDGASLT